MDYSANTANEQRQVEPQIEVSKTDSVTCEECNGGVFDMVFMIRRLSALLSPTGQEMMVPVQTFKCVSCSHINKEFVKNLEPEQESNKAEA